VLALAETLLERYRTSTPHALRSLDAIQLASAEQARSTLLANERADLIFVTVDRQLRGVAGHEGFQSINPEYPPAP
jgi:predicted nucleic acid-binding protein